MGLGAREVLAPGFTLGKRTRMVLVGCAFIGGATLLAGCSVSGDDQSTDGGAVADDQSTDGGAVAPETRDAPIVDEGDPAAPGPVTVIVETREPQEVTAYDAVTGSMLWARPGSFSDGHPARPSTGYAMYAGEDEVVGYDLTAGAKVWSINRQEANVGGIGVWRYTKHPHFVVRSAEARTQWLVIDASSGDVLATERRCTNVEGGSVCFVEPHWTNDEQGALFMLDEEGHVAWEQSSNDIGGLGEVGTFAESESVVVVIGTTDGPDWAALAMAIDTSSGDVLWMERITSYQVGYPSMRTCGTSVYELVREADAIRLHGVDVLSGARTWSAEGRHEAHCVRGDADSSMLLLLQDDPSSPDDYEYRSSEHLTYMAVEPETGFQVWQHRFRFVGFGAGTIVTANVGLVVDDGGGLKWLSMSTGQVDETPVCEEVRQGFGVGLCTRPDGSAAIVARRPIYSVIDVGASADDIAGFRVVSGHDPYHLFIYDEPRPRSWEVQPREVIDVLSGNEFRLSDLP